MLKTALSSAPHILLVDDSRDGLLVRRTLLEEQGYRVDVADCPEDGLKLYASSTFDVVVTDFRMPRMDGKELIKRIRRQDPDARIILLSGFVEPLGLTEENTGADAVIAKTAGEVAHLTRWVKRLLNRNTRKPPSAQKRGIKPVRAASH